MTDLAVSLFIEVVPTATHWSQAIAHVVNFYLDDSRKQSREEIVKLAEMRTTDANKQVAAHIRAALGELLFQVFPLRVLTPW